jgi:hypothetical protein
MLLTSCFRSSDKDDISESESESDHKSEDERMNNVEYKIELAKKHFDDRLKELETIFKVDNRDLLSASIAPTAEPKGNGMVIGPNDGEELLVEGRYVAAKSFSSYPMKPKSKKAEEEGVEESDERLGDPICDCFSFETFQHSTAIISVADGCNWGPKPLEAARVGTTVFQEYMKKKIPKIDSIRKAGYYLIQAFSHAHVKILRAPLARGMKDVWETGTTTLTGGILLKLSDEAARQFSAQYVFVCASVGDCKAFHYDAKTRKVKDVTVGNRPAASITNVNDPGGRLGPYVGKEGGADLRNLGLFVVLCNENDLILCLSDGIYDNFDPQQLGVATGDVNVSAADWETADVEEAEKAKDAYRTKLLAEKVKMAIDGEVSEDEDEKNGDNMILQKNNNNNDNNDDGDKKGKDKASEEEQGSKNDDLDLAAFIRTLVKHTKRVTQYSRTWMEEHPTARMPDARSKKKDPSFQGKMDHSTAIVVRVGWQ